MSDEIGHNDIIIISTDGDNVLDVSDGGVVALTSDCEQYDEQDGLVMVTPSSDLTPLDTEIKRRRSTYSVSKKLEILNKYETLYKRNARRTERETGVPRKCIQRWLQQRDKIEELAKAYYDDSGNELRSYNVRESRAVFPELEAELAAYVIQKQKKQGYGVTRSEVSRLAMKIFPSVYPSKDPSCFKASKHWFNNFMQRLRDSVEYVPRGAVSSLNEDEQTNSKALRVGDTKSHYSSLAADIRSVDKNLIKSEDITMLTSTSPGASQCTHSMADDVAADDISTNDSTTSRRCRSTYSLQFKYSVIQQFYSDYGQSITRTAKCLEIPRKCIHRWIQQEDKIKSLLKVEESQTNENHRRPSNGKKDVSLAADVTCYVKSRLTGNNNVANKTSKTKEQSTPKKEPTVRKGRAMYSLELKKEIIEKYDQLYNSSIRRTARETGIPRKCVQRWVRQREKIEGLVNLDTVTPTGKKANGTRKRLIAQKEEDAATKVEDEVATAGLCKRRRYFEERMLPIPPELENAQGSLPINCDEDKVFILQDADEQDHDASCAVRENTDMMEPQASPSCELKKEEEGDDQEEEKNLYDKSGFDLDQVANGEVIITVLPSDLVDVPPIDEAYPTTELPSQRRRNRSSYSLSTKLAALDNYFNVYGQNCRRTAREMGIPRKCVQRWVQQRDKIQEWSRVKEHSNLKKLFTFRGRKPEYPELEKELIRVLRGLLQIGETFTVRQLGEKAKSLFSALYPERDPDAFKASNHWVRNFLKRAQEEIAEAEVEEFEDEEDERCSPSVGIEDFDDARADCMEERDDIEVMSINEEERPLYVLPRSEEDSLSVDEGSLEAHETGEERSLCELEEESMPSMISIVHMIPLQ